ncbi:NHLP leader peptide domain protein [Kordia sp. SMS9]|uniref:NHLP leader peptide family RiPP precursor n=1 Tax=Kordia sp. SMS9 TaxID=2282170 RepID=UPI000E0E0166|nr:NHLP leader peptide family RiPP precursor [Kordia sp. SMS9]AXG69011.1 NHLP leader peptide domain protein [Kordia sp. SMS9]
MKLTAQQQKSQELLQTIITKAWEDENFKQELIEDPIDAIERATGERIRLPEGKTLIVKDQTNTSAIYINIPAEPNIEDMELNEEQLEAVAGGSAVWTFPIINLPTNPSKDGFK